MKAYSEFRGFAATADTVVARDRSPFTGQPQLRVHNPRGLVLALAMSAACWAGLGIAFLL